MLLAIKQQYRDVADLGLFDYSSLYKQMLADIEQGLWQGLHYGCGLGGVRSAEFRRMFRQMVKAVGHGGYYNGDQVSYRRCRGDAAAG
jgi:hypothetical protein